MIMGGKEAAVDTTSAPGRLTFPLHEASAFEAESPGEVVYLWMTRKEICDFLGVPPHTLYRLVQRGEVECNREEDRLRYRPTRLDLDLADLEAQAERAAVTTSVAEMHRSRYLDALVALVDGLTERLIGAEKGLARASQARDDALVAAHRSTQETGLVIRQLNAYVQSLVESNNALHDANATVRALRQQLLDLRGELLEVAASTLALPIRSRLVGMAQRADVG
jgi:hypothetical protein